MKPKTHGRRAALMALFLAAVSFNAPAQQPSVQDRVGALKANLAQSQANLRSYEWIETTVVSLNGDEKSRKQARCYYGADGALQKVPVSASPAPAEKRGLRGKIIENKKADLTDYMMQAVGLLKSYVPLEPDRIQSVVGAGRVTLAMIQPGSKIRLNFSGYQKPGDNLAIDVNPATNLMTGLAVSTYLASPADPVTLNVSMSNLPDGTTYAAQVTLVAAAKGVQVVVQNTGYRKTS